MYEDFLISRPFSRWDLKPEIGEPSYGYFARLVEDEGQKSLKTYATEVGLNGRYPNPVELLTSLERLGFSDDNRERLRCYTPITDGEFVRIGDSTLRRGQFSFSNRRFCPKCIAEKAVHRVWWDITSFTFCPIHSVKIADTTSNGNRLKWWWANIAVSPNGEDLATVPVDSAAGSDMGFERLILGRLGVVHTVEPELLIGKPLYEIIDAATMLASVLSCGTTKIDSEMFVRGFSVLNASKAKFIDSLRTWLLETVSEKDRKGGFRRAYGPSVYFWNNKQHSPFAKEIFAAMREALAPVGRLGRKTAKSVSSENLEIGLKEATRLFGVAKDALKAFAKHIGLETGRYNYFFDAAAISKLEAALSNLATVDEAATITGIAPHEYLRLEKAGLITGLTGVSRGGRPGKRYLRTDIEKLVHRMTEGLENAKDASAKPLGKLRRSRLFRPSDFLIQMDRGELQAVCVDPRYAGLASLCFMLPENTKSRNIRRRQTDGGKPPVTDLTFIEAAIYAGLDRATIPDLVNGGALRLVDSGSNRSLIERRSFEEFHATYANVQIYREALECNQNNLIARLQDAGVTIGYDGGRISTSNVLVRREEVRRAFQIAMEPDDPKLGSFPLWEEFRSAVSVGGSAYFVAPTFIHGEARIATANYNVSLKAIVFDDGKGFSLNFFCSERSSPRRWRKLLATLEKIVSLTPGVHWEISAKEVDGSLAVYDENGIESAIKLLWVLNFYINQKVAK